MRRPYGARLHWSMWGGSATSIRALIDRLRTSPFAKDSAVLGAGMAGAQLVTVAAVPVLSRLYSPSDFGLLAIFTAISSIVATAITLRYETAILLPKGDAEAQAVHVLALGLAVAIGAVLCAAAQFAPERAMVALGVGKLGVWFPVSVATGIAAAILTAGSAWLNRQGAYGRLASLRMGQSAVIVTVSVVLGMSGHGSGLLVAQVAGAALVALVIGSQVLASAPRSSFRAVVEAASAHRAAPIFLLPTALLDSLTLQMPVFLITAWFGGNAAGQFSMAWRVLALPMALIGGAIAQVFYQRFSQAWPDAAKARALLFSTWKVLALIGLVPTVMLMLWGAPIFVWVLGDAWGDAGVIASIIAPMLWAMLVSSPTSTTFLVLGLQKYMPWFGIAVLIYRPACLAVGFAVGNIHVGLVLLTVAEIIQLVIYQRLALRRMSASL